MQPCTIQKIALTITLLAAMAFLLLFRLDHYALWDDEATTALFGQSVAQTGQPDARRGKNLIAYNSGVELKDLKNRYIPPLSFYLASFFVDEDSTSAGTARLPFAISGLLTVGILLMWLWRSKVSVLMWILIWIGWLGNVSMMLYFRQCRYYGPVICLTVILSYLYLRRKASFGYVAVLTLTSLSLLSANYLCYAGVMLVMAIDYLVWGRHSRRLPASHMIAYIGLQLIFGGALFIMYWPFGVDVYGMPSDPWWTKFSTLWIWNWRDLNTCEFAAMVVLLSAPIVAYIKQDTWLARSFTALMVYITAVAALSPQPLALMPVAAVRYLVPILPLCIWISARMIFQVAGTRRWLALALAAVVFGTNIPHGAGWGFQRSVTVFSQAIPAPGPRSTIVEFIRELMNPHPSAYQQAADWITDHVQEGKSVWVVPGYATYPLMYHAPKALYAWQLQEEVGQFQGMAAIHFFGRQAPDYIVAFGPYQEQVDGLTEVWQRLGVRYQSVHVIPTYWYDLIRPELFWHTFQPIGVQPDAGQDIRIFQRVAAGR